MSVYKSARSPYWHFDFQVRGHRFHGTTKCTTRREAEKVEAAERDKAKRLVAQLAAAKTSLKLDDVADRWWSEVGQHHAGANNTEHELALLIEFFGKDKLLPEITGDDVARLGAWRRGHRRKDGALISPHTVNHTMKQLRKLFTRTKLWGVRFEHEPRWSKYLLAVPDERVRELSDDEADRLDAVMRDDLAPSSPSPSPPGCGSLNVSCAGRRLIGAPSKFASLAKADALSRFRSRRPSARFCGHYAGIIKIASSRLLPIARLMAVA